ncbi:MAG: hypothetical protein ACOYL0_00005, partial [Limnohabitans sp.]
MLLVYLLESLNCCCQLADKKLRSKWLVEILQERLLTWSVLKFSFVSFFNHRSIKWLQPSTPTSLPWAH